MSVDLPLEAVKNALNQALKGKSYVSPNGLIGRLVKLSGLDPISIKQALSVLSKTQWLEGVAQDGTPYSQIKILAIIPPPPVPPLQAIWTEALTNVELSPDEATALAPCWNKLDGLSLQDMCQILTTLKRLKIQQADLVGTSSFLISARNLLGSSKLLTNIPEKNLKAFGLASSQFKSHPSYVVVGGSSSPRSVVLVENPTSFELALTSTAINHCAFIATFGYGLSMADNEYGNQLASIVDSGLSNTVSLIREGSSCPPANELLKHSNITFWGDLDPAGLQIFLRLKSKLPDLKLSAIYQPMIEMLKSPTQSHPYVLATGKFGQQNIKTKIDEDDVLTQFLYQNCLTRGVDQESVDVDAISLLAGDHLQDESYCP